MNVFDIVVAFVVVVLKKLFYKKSIFCSGWFDIYIYIVKLLLKLRLNKK